MFEPVTPIIIDPADLEGFAYDETEDDVVLGGKSCTDLLPLTTEQLTKEARRARNIARCGSWFTGVLPHNGKTFRGHFYCGYEQHCPLCFKRRQGKMAARLGDVLHQHQIRINMVKLSRKSATAFCRTLAQEDFFRIPGEALDTIFFNAARKPATGTSINLENYLTQPWAEYAKRVPGRKTSGALGLYEPPVPADAIDAEITQYMLFPEPEPNMEPATYEMFKAVHAFVDTQTNYLNPQTVAELNAALSLKADIANAVWRKLGYIPHVMTKHVTYKLSLSSINWQPKEKVSPANPFFTAINALNTTTTLQYKEFSFPLRV